MTSSIWASESIKTIVVDIETQSKASGYKRYGLMVNSPIKHIALYCPEIDHAEVIDVDYSPEQKDFLKGLFSRPNLVIVGHNVVFDLRHLGIHFDIRLDPSTEVHDTYTLAIRLLWGDSDEDQSLSYYAQRIILDPSFQALFFSLKDVSDVVPRDSLLPTYLNMKKVREGDGLAGASLWRWYNLMDVMVTYVLYQAQLSFVRDVESGDAEVPYRQSFRPLIVPKWQDIRHLFKFWRKLLRISAEQAVRGVKVDVAYLNSLYDKAVAEASASASDLLDKMVAGLCGSDAYTFSYLCIRLSVDFCQSLNRNKWVKLPGFFDYTLTLPGMEDWREKLQVSQIFYPIHVFAEFARFFSEVPPIPPALEGFSRLVSSKFNGDLVALVNSDGFASFLIELCGIPFPTEDEIASHPYLITAKGARSFSRKAVEYYLSGDYVASCQNEQVLGYLSLYRKCLEKNSLSIQYFEVMQHAEFTGRIHSLIIPATRTGRDISTLPNLQNKRMGDFAGVFVPDEGYTLVEMDISNAESVMAAALGPDNEMAKAVMGNDFHMFMTEVYWPDKVRALREAGDHAGLKALRKLSKAPTFAIPYGAGPSRIASVVGCTLSEAQALIDMRKRAFAGIEKAKDRYATNAQKRFDAGYVAYVPLWDRSRVAVEVKTKIGGQDLSKPVLVKHTQWNYLQQGGVSVLVHRAIVEIDQWLRDNNYRSYIAFNIHDSLILSIWDEEYLEVLPKLCDIMYSVAPRELTHRTNPPVSFVADYCPRTNMHKWGYENGKTYRHPTSHYINRYGVFPYPEGAVEAPVWKWDLRLSDTPPVLDSHPDQSNPVESPPEVKTVDGGATFEPTFSNPSNVIEFYDNLVRLFGESFLSTYVRTIIYRDDQARDREYLPSSFRDYMLNLQLYNTDERGEVLSALCREVEVLYKIASDLLSSSFFKAYRDEKT